jgi:glycosyltransferase involved in cell wall biosynthesis
MTVLLQLPARVVARITTGLRLLRGRSITDTVVLFLDVTRRLIRNPRQLRQILISLDNHLPADFARLESRLENALPKLTRDDEASRRDGPLAYILAGSLPHMRSGYAMRSQHLATALLAAGQPLVCLTRPGFPLDYHPGLVTPDSPVSTVESVGPVRYGRLQTPRQDGMNLPAYIEAASAALEAALKPLAPAAVMAASNHLTALPALIAARSLGLPFIYEVRGFWEITRLSANPAWAETGLYRNALSLETLTARKADLVFTLNGPMQAELIRRGVASDRIRLLPNACDPTSFLPAPRDQALAALYDLPEGVPVIGYVGSFVEYEGLDDLILACAGLMRRGLDFRLVLVGDEIIHRPLQVRITPRLRQLIAETGLTERVCMPGRVVPNDVARWYSLIDIAPLPRKPRPVTMLVPPLKPLEAMAMGKAVVASDVAALADMIEDQRTGLLFPKGKVTALEAALARLIVEPELRVRLGAAAREWVLAERSWDRMAERVRAAVSELSRA